MLHSVIGPENFDCDSRYSLKQSDAKQNQIVWSPAFSRVCAFLLYSEYSLVFEAGMGRSHYFGFDFTIFDRQVLYYSSTWWRIRWKCRLWREWTIANKSRTIRTLHRGYMNIWLWLDEKRTFLNLPDKEA